jgi:hypothetical protein
MGKLYRFLKGEEDGAITIIVALSLSVIIVFAAFVTDFGLAYVKASETQNGADAAALAAARLLPVDPDDAAEILEVYDTAVEYAGKNGLPPITAQDVALGDVINGKYTSVKVNIPNQAELNFAKIIGISTFNVSRSATARIAPCMSAEGAAPLGVEYTQLMDAIASGDTEHIYLKYGGGGRYAGLLRRHRPRRCQGRRGKRFHGLA